MGYWGYPRYVTVAEKRAKATKKLEKLRKKNPHIKPVVVEGRAIARTWWGKSWNLNLERYADYSNRIGRGRNYVRHGAVLDLQIGSGKVEALVQGSRSKPYSVTIKIKAVHKKIWREIKAACEGKLDSLKELLSGKFPKALDEIFTARGRGLFPSPKEIAFSCSCPDWASMCKHVAATLYGIGARLDEAPGLFFKLRQVKMKDLVTGVLEDKTRKLLKKAKKKTARVIDESALGDVFGIDFDDPVALRGKRAKGPGKRTGGKRPPKPISRRAQAKPMKGKPEKKITSRKVSSRENPPPYNTVAGIIRRSRRGVTVAIIREKTGFDDRQIRNAIYRAKKQGRIQNLKRGVYISS